MEHRWVRTFHARHGRVSPAMRRAIDELGERLLIPDGRLDAGAVFGRRAPLVLEVGCGHGADARAYARLHPDHDVVAVDVHTPGVAHLLQGIAAEGLANLRVVHGDALELLHDRLDPGSLTRVHVLFPDPWPKTRHHKRRFLRPDVLDLLADRMAPGAVLHVASDVNAYVTWARERLDAHPAFSGGSVPAPDWRTDHGYAARAASHGRRATDLAYVRGGGAGVP